MPDENYNRELLARVRRKLVFERCLMHFQGFLSATGAALFVSSGQFIAFILFVWAFFWALMHHTTVTAWARERDRLLSELDGHGPT